ncbi:CLUMA_CG004411, isoform A [Clunio marinus]|uniref:CLUMA_CG004411, isoform A n=1 Tax=Clunio marinus TaxID=568069 RepID=A0A1J1HW29_9DIPT|nr:CLUMA_CG004411, isoform A [Clunio marinus]
MKAKTSTTANFHHAHVCLLVEIDKNKNEKNEMRVIKHKKYSEIQFSLAEKAQATPVVFSLRLFYSNGEQTNEMKRKFEDVMCSVHSPTNSVIAQKS